MATEFGVVITDAGIAEVINAEHSGTAPVVLSAIAFGTGQYVPSASQTALQHEFKRMNTLTGGYVGDNTIHVTITDSDNDTYSVYEVGIFTDRGTLFAVYSQTTPIINKAARSSIMLAVDMVLAGVNPESVTVGDTNFILPPATTSQQGIVELATNDETREGTDASRAVTPAGLNALTANDSRRGLVELATLAETLAGTDNLKAITPASLLGAFPTERGTSGFQKLPNGLIIQWGTALMAADGTTAVTLPTTFPNTVVYANAFSLNDVQAAFTLASYSNGGVKFSHNGDGAVTAFFLVIGY